MASRSSPTATQVAWRQSVTTVRPAASTGWRKPASPTTRTGAPGGACRLSQAAVAILLVKTAA
ncbi:hypothetical protein [Candidatus Amarolinea dominans]|uniref:hypothetical protein n=1 Tax=Candidatus Amarolinea dominans TaxID=3140696 RepID=UPI0031CC68CD